MSGLVLQPNELPVNKNSLTGEINALSQSERWKLIQKCGGILRTSVSQKKLVIEMEEMLPYAAKKFNVDYQADLVGCSKIRADLADLVMNLQITAATLMFFNYDLLGWQDLADSGEILDVFSPDGMEAIYQRMRQANQVMKDTISRLKIDAEVHSLHQTN